MSCHQPSHAIRPLVPLTTHVVGSGHVRVMVMLVVVVVVV
jgi:hypothetical protein